MNPLSKVFDSESAVNVEVICAGEPVLSKLDQRRLLWVEAGKRCGERLYQQAAQMQSRALEGQVC